MPVTSLPSLPSGSDIYIDANILIYSALGQSNECLSFLNRLGNDIFGYSDIKVLHDVMHQLMIAEVKSIDPSKASPKKLKTDPSLISSLTAWRGQVSILLQLPIYWIAIDMNDINRVPNTTTMHGLLCGDSLIASQMNEFGIKLIASHDEDFDRAGFMVFSPSDI